MLAHIVALICGISFGLLGLGYWLKSKAVMFAGATIMLLIGGAIMFPDVYGGTIEFISGSVETFYQNVTNVTANTTTYNATTTKTRTYDRIDFNAGVGIGLTLILTSIFLMYAIFFDEKLE